MFDITNIDRLSTAVEERIKKVDKRAGVLIKKAVSDFVEAMLLNTPVWSGRTVESVRVSNTAVFAALQGVPSAQEQATFGPTNSQPLGVEAMRPRAEAAARGQVDGGVYGLQHSVFITMYSEAWQLVEDAKAPNHERARNKAVVSERALTIMRSSNPILR